MRRGKMTGTLDGTVELDGEVEPLTRPPGRNWRLRANYHPQRASCPLCNWTRTCSNCSGLRRWVRPPETCLPSPPLLWISPSPTIRSTPRKPISSATGLTSTVPGASPWPERAASIIKAWQDSPPAITPSPTLLGGMSGVTLAHGKMVFPFNLTGTLQNPQFTLKPSGAGTQTGTANGIKP